MKTKSDSDCERGECDSPPDASRIERFLGIDVGAETIKIIEVLRDGPALGLGRRRLVEHHKEPTLRLLELLGEFDWGGLSGAAVSGRLARLVRLPRVPTKQAQARGFRFLFGERPATVVSIGGHGFSVLELRPNGLEVLRENSRCSQGTGNFLRQLCERFDLTPAEASEVCAEVEHSAPLSGRCPVILKTDMTHLANKGEKREAILAGLFDAVCENVMVLVKPGISPADVALVGGVSRSRRIRNTFATMLGTQDMRLLDIAPDQVEFLEALGSALLAAENPAPVPPLAGLLVADTQYRVDTVAGLSGALRLVRRMPAPARPGCNGHVRQLILGLDIGSTGSKAVALDAATQEVIWEGYRRTAGDPVGAAQALLSRFVAERPGDGVLRAFGVTGSGREIAGSLMTTCYGGEAVFVLNEIAAHAAGARHFDPRVDTIFEIGGQDAKYIRLVDGRVVDCAMNEACSAGTGSFIEEQGSKFPGIQGVAQLGAEAMLAAQCVSLGQHCSVFMAEVIGEAVAAGCDQREIIAGLYDSIIQNYLHRVKGNRSVGSVIFCQGMPFASDALAAAVARQTGSEIIIPPNPGTVGALGIALLARMETQWQANAIFDPQRFLDARIESKETFICHSKTGCGGAGNRCRIDSINTVVTGRGQRFNWGGACTLYDKGTRKRKLPDLSPDPFREREALVTSLVAALGETPGAETIAVTDEFTLKGVLPLFATFFRALGFNLRLSTGADHSVLKRGVKEANIPYCAPMQLYHGLTSLMAEAPADFLFLPMLRSLPRVDREPYSKVCPVVQASPWLLRHDLAAKLTGRVLSPVIDVGAGNYDSAEFRQSCASLAGMLGKTAEASWLPAWRQAIAAQRAFESACEEIGRRALEFCAARQVPAVVVLGRPYTIYNKVLNSNVPAILREQGAMAIPVDCFPVPAEVPVFDDMYWAQAQRILRAAHQVRRLPGVHALYCSNYSCGPDSFNLHFFAHIMEGKPFAIIETDGHAGDAGTKTRVEAFLHCVAGEGAAGRTDHEPNAFAALQHTAMNMLDIHPDERVLIPVLGVISEVYAACLRGLGWRAETLPPVDAEALRIGRRLTSGKECIPACMTLGALVKRLQRDGDASERFIYCQPDSKGPCRYGVYNLLTQIALEHSGLRERVRIWAPGNEGYFDKLPPGFALLVFAGFVAAEALQEALLEVRPVETTHGAANEIYQRAMAALLAQLQARAGTDLRLAKALWQVANGDLLGFRGLLTGAAREFAAVRGTRRLPTALVVGEIYVRSNAFANDDVVARLEARGVRVKLATCGEFIEYTDHVNRQEQLRNGLRARLSTAAQERLRSVAHRLMARELGGHDRVRIAETLAAARGYVPESLEGEAVLTVGAALQHWRAGLIDAVVNVGPLECLPSKVAEAQFFHIAQNEGLPSLTLALNGDPINAETLDNFAFEVHERFRKHAGRGTSAQGCSGSP
ncbi:MAG: acyl-CoA dehydratase activase-related protein [Verrucomicrobia bacterium]|nr:acyl-CoA dehydratase activase-related protein [Verrucomicrobiota bacterium]